MQFRIHYTIGAVEDCLIIDEDTMDEVKSSVKSEMQQRGLDQDKNNMWSEQVGT